MKKYKMTTEKIFFEGSILYRIQALKSFDNIKEGELGGWIESEWNLSQSGNCWVDDDAIVIDNARVEGNALVMDFAQIENDAIVKDNAQVSEYARVSDKAIVGGRAKIFGEEWIDGNTKIFK